MGISGYFENCHPLGLPNPQSPLGGKYCATPLLISQHLPPLQAACVCVCVCMCVWWGLDTDSCIKPLPGQATNFHNTLNNSGQMQTTVLVVSPSTLDWESWLEVGKYHTMNDPEQCTQASPYLMKHRVCTNDEVRVGLQSRCTCWGTWLYILQAEERCVQCLHKLLKDCGSCNNLQTWNATWPASDRKGRHVIPTKMCQTFSFAPSNEQNLREKCNTSSGNAKATAVSSYKMLSLEHCPFQWCSFRHSPYANTQQALATPVVTGY